MLGTWTPDQIHATMMDFLAIVTAISALVAAVGVALSKIRGDKILNAANTAVAQNNVLADKADEQVRTTVQAAERLETTTQQTAAALSTENKDIAKKLFEATDTIHEKVNGRLTEALKTTADALARVAEITGRSEDKIAAMHARSVLNSNEGITDANHA